jgi:hypothetical protein
VNRELVIEALVDTVPEMMILPMSPRADCDHSEKQSDDIRSECLICGEVWYEL